MRIECGMRCGYFSMVPLLFSSHFRNQNNRTDDRFVFDSSTVTVHIEQIQAFKGEKNSMTNSWPGKPSGSGRKRSPLEDRPCPPTNRGWVNIDQGGVNWGISSVSQIAKPCDWFICQLAAGNYSQFSWDPHYMSVRTFHRSEEKYQIPWTVTKDDCDT